MMNDEWLVVHWHNGSENGVTIWHDTPQHDKPWPYNYSQLIAQVTPDSARRLLSSLTQALEPEEDLEAYYEANSGMDNYGSLQ